MSERIQAELKGCDVCGGTWGYIRDDEHDNLWDCVTELSSQNMILQDQINSLTIELQQLRRANNDI